MAVPYMVLAGSSHVVRGFNFIHEMLEPASGSANKEYIRYFRNVETLALGGTSAATFRYYLTERKGDQRECITSPHDVQLIFAWLGSNSIDYMHRRFWRHIRNNQVGTLTEQIQRDADNLVKILEFLDWLHRLMPGAHLAYCSSTTVG